MAITQFQEDSSRGQRRSATIRSGFMLWHCSSGPAGAIVMGEDERSGEREEEEEKHGFSSLAITTIQDVQRLSMMTKLQRLLIRRSPPISQTTLAVHYIL